MVATLKISKILPQVLDNYETTWGAFLLNLPIKSSICIWSFDLSESYSSGNRKNVSFKYCYLMPQYIFFYDINFEGS